MMDPAPPLPDRPLRHEGRVPQPRRAREPARALPQRGQAVGPGGHGGRLLPDLAVVEHLHTDKVQPSRGYSSAAVTWCLRGFQNCGWSTRPYTIFTSDFSASNVPNNLP